MDAQLTKTLPYYGGKARVGVNRWIRSLLPTHRYLYVEPFAGMLSIMLNRPPAAVEIASDSSRHLMRWWEAVRLRPEELGQRIRATPLHRAVHEQARQMLFGPGGPPAELLDHAWAVAVVICDGLIKGCWEGSTWVPRYGPGGPISRDTLASRISVAADRLRHVQLETRDASAILERTARVSDALIYCDPPYQGTDLGPYGEHRIADHDRLIELLRAQRGDVAISGSGDIYDCLGWERHEHRTTFRGIATGRGRPRAEVLWRNFSSPPAPA